MYARKYSKITVDANEYLTLYGVVDASEKSAITLKANDIKTLSSTSNNVAFNFQAQDNSSIEAEAANQIDLYRVLSQNNSSITLNAPTINVDLFSIQDYKSDQATDNSEIIIGEENSNSVLNVKFTNKGSDLYPNQAAIFTYSQFEDINSEFHSYITTNIDAQSENKDYHGINDYDTDKVAIAASGYSKIILDKANSIYGDILSLPLQFEGHGISSDLQRGGEITITSTDVATFKGNVIAANDGKINITLNGESTIESRMDDYADASIENVFRPDNLLNEFNGKNNEDSNGIKRIEDIKEGGEINLTLKDNSVWKARGQSFITVVTFEGNNTATIDLTEENDGSVTIRNLNGNGIFKVDLNSTNHSDGNMIYIGKNTGSHIINIVNGIEGGLDGITEDNPLRIATVGIDEGSFAVTGVEGLKNNTHVRAFTRDAGMWDLEYKVGIEEFNE